MLPKLALKILSRKIILHKFKFQFPSKPTKPHSHNPIPHKTLSFFIPISNSNISENPFSKFLFLRNVQTTRFVHSIANFDTLSEFEQDPDEQSAITVQNHLKNYRERSIEEIGQALDQCDLCLTDNLVLNVLHRNCSDWKPAYIFFTWVCRSIQVSGYSPGSTVYNKILDILGKMHRFDELTKVFDEMSKRKGLVNEATFGILLHRYSAAHMVEEAIDIFYKMKDFELKLDLVAFQNLLMWLCRYKHVEAAENLFYCKQNEFGADIKMRNIILNGWCLLGNVREAKRFWKDIIASKCKPDLVTYGTFINALTKKGKLGTAMKLFRAMWENGCNPDVVICNCVIDALCFKKRIPEALEVFREMNERGCLPNVASYNSLIKHLCNIRRMEKVYELLDEMELKKGSCLPNAITFNYLLKSSKKPVEVAVLLERMEKNGCKMGGDTYNLVLKLYMDWGCEEEVTSTWNEMEKNGMGPDRRSYTIMIHGFYDQGRLEDALCYFNEMVSKGMVPESRTGLLVDAMNTKMKEGEGEQGEKGVMNIDKSLRPSRRRKDLKRAI